VLPLLFVSSFFPLTVLAGFRCNQIRDNVGIFSLFGKKEGQQANTAAKDSSRTKRDAAATRTDTAKTPARPPAPPAGKRDVQAARATAMKIDAIESEMSSEFVKPTTIQPITRPGPNTIAGSPSTKAGFERTKTGQANSELPALDFTQPTLPMMGETTEFLLGGRSTLNNIAVPATDSMAVIEEAAILFSNNQPEPVEQMLLGAIAEDNLGDHTQIAWRMLFDLYQCVGKQKEFENLSVEYTRKFETSPPAWIATGQPEPAAKPSPSGGAPMVPFSGKLDANSVKQIDRVLKLAETHRVLRLEFARVTEVDPAGCGLLLNALKKLQKSGHDLILVGAPELAVKIRATLEVGRRDETEDPWLLLLEILRLLNQEKEFEETSIDYCVTFEVSPPAFVAPKNKITTAAEQAHQDGGADVFMMPNVIEGKIDQLIVAIAAFSDEHDPAILDCTRLSRIDFTAAGRLMSGLAPFCGAGKTIEMHNVNHLVAALLNVIGLKEIVRILPRKT
jgi:anti-anti-sigma regulatory factor